MNVLGVPAEAPDFDAIETLEVPEDLDEYLRDVPFTVTRANGRAAGDIINIALEGTAEEVVNAFHAAGWILATPLTAKSFTQEYNAFSAKAGFSQAPASLLIYKAQAPAFVFEKSLNDIMQRHHVRVWRIWENGRELWLGAATRDIGIGFDPRAMKFKHRIEIQIDRERSKIVNDLTFSGCADEYGYVQRPNAERQSWEGAGIETDGRIAYLAVHACEAGMDGTVLDKPQPEGSLLMRTTRRVVLETRQYVERENTFFWTYRAVKWSWVARRPRVADDAEDE